MPGYERDRKGERVQEKRCVLYIEDDPKARVLLSKALSREFEVLTAQNGLEGLNTLQRRIPDIVLTDINLPDLSGEIVASRIRAIAGANIPIVAVTAHTDRQWKEKALTAGCIGFITKPVDTRTIANTIFEFLGGRSEHVSEGVRERAAAEMHDEMAQQLETVVRRLQEDNAELRNLEQAKTAFLTQVSHELRTPLTVINGYMQILHQRLHEDQTITDTHRELADMSVDGIRRLHNLMSEIVVMARLSINHLDVRRAPIRIGPVAMDAIQEFQQAFLDRNILFETAGEGWQLTVLADLTLIRMAMSNLLSNAIKFTPDGGRIMLWIEREKNMVHIAVADTGVGITAENLPLLFKPFYTTIDTTRGRTSKTQFMGMGMGLGLTIVTRIVEAHKGKIWAESAGYDEEQCPGSTFHILLPLMNLM
jgi:signal transduction histidine kinase